MEWKDALSKIYLAGGEALAPRDFLGVSRIGPKERELLASWVGEGYLYEEIRGKKKFYRLGTVGESMLQENQGIWESLRSRKAEADCRKVQGLLELIRDRNEKPLTAAIQNEYSAQIEICLRKEYVEEGAGRRYRLTLAGISYLDSLRPGDELLGELSQSIEALSAEIETVRAAHADLIREHSQEQPDLEKALDSHFSCARRYLEHSARELDLARKRTEIVQIAHREKEELWTAIESIEEGMQDVLSEALADAKEMQAKWREASEKSEREWRQRIEEQDLELLAQQSELLARLETIRGILSDSSSRSSLVREAQEIGSGENAETSGTAAGGSEALEMLEPETRSEPPQISGPRAEVPETEEESEPARASGPSRGFGAMPEPPETEDGSDLSDWEEIDESEFDDAREAESPEIEIPEDPPAAPPAKPSRSEKHSGSLVEKVVSGNKRRMQANPTGEADLYEHFQENLLEKEVEPPADLDEREFVLETLRSMLAEKEEIPLPDLFDRLREQVPMSITRFEHLIRSLRPELNLETADPHSHPRGFWIAGKYYFYVTA